MGTQKYGLKINKPCSEDWDTMTENEQGRFCSSCSKNVTDFTSLSNSEILAIYDKNPVNHCGRLTKSQLENGIIQEEISRSTNLLKVAAGLILALISKDAISSNVKAKPTPRFVVQNTINPDSKSNNNINIVEQDSLQNTLKGMLIDSSNNDPMPFANVVIKGTKIGVASDFDGRFTLQIPDSIKTKKLMIVVSSIGYQTTQILFDRTKPQTEELVFMVSTNLVIMGDVVIVKKKWWQRKR
jgi:hypothetical protein